MKKWTAHRIKPYMLRPIIVKTVSGLLIAAAAAVLWDRFVNGAGRLDTVSYALPVIAAFFAGHAWFTFLRLDRVDLPRLPRIKKRTGGAGSMADAAGTRDESFEELTREERDMCTLVASLICAAVLILVSLL